jgi:hypothetical protein
VRSRQAERTKKRRRKKSRSSVVFLYVFWFSLIRSGFPKSEPKAQNQAIARCLPHETASARAPLIGVHPPASSGAILRVPFNVRFDRSVGKFPDFGDCFIVSRETPL